MESELRWNPTGLSWSNDLHPADYGIWGLFLERVLCREPIRDLAKLKQWPVNTWADVKQSVVDKIIDQ